MPINYVGHAASWDELSQEGNSMARDVAVRFRRGGQTLSVASIYRDPESLEADLAFAQNRSS